MKPRRIVVTGLAATYPYGGVFWDYLAYALGLRALGHEVVYLEDPELWCYSPRRRTFVADGSENAAVFAGRLGALATGLPWAYRDAAGRWYGLDREDLVRACRQADLLLEVSLSCVPREEYAAPAVRALVDSDPMFTQASLPAYVAGTLDATGRAQVEALLAHDVFLTFAGNVGAADCKVPDALVDWQPTRQPVLLEVLARAAVPVARRCRRASTVAAWEATKRPPPVVDGVRCGGKRDELERFRDLPVRSPLPVHLALSGDLPAERITGWGFVLDDADVVSATPEGYLGYLAGSLVEWSVAKQAYVASRSGWFSCRSACYLALGVPVVVQDTGFTAAGVEGEGVFAFSTTDEAVAALERVAAEPERYARAALDTARRFAAEDVLDDVLSVALDGG